MRLFWRRSWRDELEADAERLSSSSRDASRLHSSASCSSPLRMFASNGTFMSRSGMCGPPGVDGVVRVIAPLDELRDGIGVDEGTLRARNVNSVLVGGAASIDGPSAFSFSDETLGVRNICCSFMGENISPPIAFSRSRPRAGVAFHAG